MFPYISLYQTCDPPGGPIFWPQGHNLNNIGRGPVDNATNQRTCNGLAVFWPTMDLAEI